MISVYLTNYCSDDDKRTDFSGYSLVSIKPKDGEETIKISYYFMDIEEGMYGEYRSINKEFDIMVSPKRIEEVKEYLNKNGVNYSVSIEDVQKHFEENGEEGKEMNEKIDRYKNGFNVIDILKFEDLIRQNL